MENCSAIVKLLLLSIIICLSGHLSVAQNYVINTLDGDTIAACTGSFYDSGSSTGNYSDNEKFTVTFHAPGGKRIIFDFTSLKLVAVGGDILRIFDGADTLSTIIGTYAGIEESPFTVQSTDSALTFQFTSDGSLVNEGWEASISCCSIPITSDITGSNSECVNSAGVSYSVTETSGSKYEWFITGGTQASGTNTNSITVDWGGTSGPASVKVVEDNGCTLGDTVVLNVTLNALPVVSFSGLDTVCQITGPPIALTGDPAGGVFTGDGISGSQFSPAVAGLGTHQIIYSYSDLNLCESSDTQYVDVRNFDQIAEAIWLTDLNGWCSGNAQYTNVGATADGPSPGCWSGGVGNNVWFKFNATTSAVNIEVKTGEAFGSMRGQQIALWNSNNVLVKCIEAAENYGVTLPLSIDTLTPGHTYWISVDDRRVHGTFTLCIDDNASYDYRSGAVEITDINNYCSADAEYANTYATADGSTPSCWTGGVGNNVWFKFDALSNGIIIDVETGGTAGTMRGQQIALWNEDGTQIMCANADYSHVGVLSLSTDTLTAGHTYYISVDDRRTHGTFKLYVNDSVSYDYQSGAIELADIRNYQSADEEFSNEYMTADGNTPPCWSGGVGNNVWFKFDALSNGILIDVETGGTAGTMRGQQIALWNEAGVLVNCANADYSYVGVLSLSTDTLTAGHTYYISVDDRRNQGTFKLSVNDSVSYDFQSGAIELDDIKDYQSADEEFSNKYMTADGNVPPCWAGGVGNNVWFKFDAISEVVKIDVLTGNSYGTMRGQQIALWNEAGTLVKCASAAYNYSGELSLQTDTLTIGNTYWISVDDRTTNGTFTLAIDNEVGFDYKIGAIYLIDLDGWSSADAEYDNTYATEDESAGSCWTGGAGNNVWFKFEAATPNIAISVVTGAGKGTMRGQQIALWNENNDQVGCMNAAYNYSGVLTVSADTLTVGKYYWISVDDRTTHGTFTLEVDNKVPFDLKSGAILLTDLDYWCSDAAAYNNTYATFDEAAGSCWSGGSDNNVWFKFVAISGDIQVDVKTGNPYGSMRGQQIALWNEAGTQVQCANAAYNFSGTLTLTSDTLTPGRTYYISVDDRTTHGTFTLCVNNKAGFDYPSGAKVLPHVNSWCSALANYTNTYATADGADPSCWAGGVGNNVWYKFTATTSSLTFKVITGGSYGTMRGQQIALWREDGTEVKCANAGYNYNGVLSLSIDTLTIGYTYYISVADRTTHGSFSVCISNEVDYDYKAGAILLSDLSSWSSAIAEYSNTYATADESAGSCWAGGVGNNVWFKFIATTNSIDIDVVTGGAYGTMRGQQIALWREDGTEVKCANAGYNYSGALSLSTDTLTIGHTYYVSVDDRTTHGTFTLEIDDTPSYDFKQGAILLADLDNWTSNMAEYDNSYATPDESAGSCWAGGVGNNVWFKFVAISGEIEIQVITGGLNGTMRGQQIAIWNEAGDQLQCANAGYNFSGTLSATIDTLTSGRTYYISVDDRTTHGTFTLYVNNKVGFDFKSGAIELTKLDGWCSSNAAYNNTYATAGDTSGTCWSGTSDRNVWFTFEAIFDTLTVDVVTGEAYGTMRGQQIALWNEAGNQVACKNGAYNFNGTLQLKVDTLSPGRRYWISIDERTTPGTFSLCINNVSNIDYWAIANGNWNDNSSWSRTEGGTAASTSPSRANNVYIKGYSISVTDAQSCANLEVDVANSNTSLTVDDGTLSIKGDLNFINSGADYTGSINLLNAGIINVNADLTVDRSGGSSEFKIELLQGSKLNISNNASISSSTGTTSNVEVVLGGSSELNIENDFIMSNTGGPKVVVTANNSSVIDVNRHIEYNSTASDKIEIELNDNANLLIAGNFYRGASNYGILNCNGNSTLVFNGQSFIQTLPKNSGGGTDSFSYQNQCRLVNLRS
ncbi:MAG: hypothetical protein PHD00_08010 [Bacteroidales bacterium]|nr:hypothetical protein [Bacteroidales bacterium]